MPEQTEIAYNQIAEDTQKLIDSARQLLPGLPQIHFDFVWSGTVNAWAFKEEGRYFVCLTTGTIYLLTLVFMRMLSDSRLFPTIGNPKEEADDLPPLRGYIPNAEEMYQSGQRFTIPRNNPRRQFALSRLRKHALLFLVGHEIAHITLGHVDYWQSQFGLAVISELGWGHNNPDKLIERQTLEWDADRRSIFSRIASIELEHRQPDLPVPLWSNSPESPGLMIYHFMFAINTLFRLFGDVRFNSLDLSNSSYPPFPLRRAMAGVTMLHAANSIWGPTLHDVTLHALQIANKHTEISFAMILGQNISMYGLIDAFSPIGKDHNMRLFKYMEGGLRERLAPFTYE